MSLPDDQVRGTFTKSWTVFCGCGMWNGEYMNSPRDAARHARSIGFRLTKEHGWLCPACVEKRDEPATPEDGR